MTLADVKASELTPAVRDWVQALLHRPLAANDCVSVVVHSTAPSIAAERTAAWERLRGRLASFRRGGDLLPDAELDAAVDEAMRAVRPGYESLR